MKLNPLPYTTYKNGLKVDQRPKHKSQDYKLLEENIEEKLHDIGFAIHFLDMTPKAQATEVKIGKLDIIKI